MRNKKSGSDQRISQTTKIHSPYLQIEGTAFRRCYFFAQRCKITEDTFSLIEYQPLTQNIIKITNKHLHIKSKYLKQWEISRAKNAVSHTMRFHPMILIEKHPSIQIEILYQAM